MTVVLEGMSPAQEQGWLVLLDLFRDRRTDWTLIGGQMMFLLAVENGVTMPRTTTDMDVVINVVESPGAIQAFASQLLQEGFEFGDVSPAHPLGHLNLGLLHGLALGHEVSSEPGSNRHILVRRRERRSCGLLLPHAADSQVPVRLRELALVLVDSQNTEGVHSCVLAEHCASGGLA